MGSLTGRLVTLGMVALVVAGAAALWMLAVLVTRWLTGDAEEEP